MPLLTKLRAAADCPTVHRTDRGTPIVQGYRMEYRMSLPPGEPPVEVPADPVTEAARTVG